MINGGAKCKDNISIIARFPRGGRRPIINVSATPPPGTPKSVNRGGRCAQGDVIIIFIVIVVNE